MSLQIWMILLIHSLLFMIPRMQPRQDRRLSHIFASFPCSLPTLPISTLPLLCLVLAFPSQFGRLTLQGTPANTLFIADLRARVHNRRCLPLHLSLAYTYSLRITDLGARVNDGLRTSLGTHWSSLTALDLAVVEGTFRARPAGDAWGQPSPRLVHTGASSQPASPQSSMVHSGPGPQGMPGGQPRPRLVGEAKIPIVLPSASTQEITLSMNKEGCGKN